MSFDIVCAYMGTGVGINGRMRRMYFSIYSDLKALTNNELSNDFNKRFSLNKI